MKTTFSVIGPVVALVLGLLASPAGAGAAPNPRKIAFSGVITSVDDFAHLLDDTLAVDTPFSGYYTFDANTVDTNGDPTVGDYTHAAAPYGIVVRIGNYVFRTDPAHIDFLIETVNREQDDHYLLRSYGNVCSRPIPVEHISWQCDDFTGAALSNDTLPSDPPDLAAFSQDFGLSITGGTSMSYFIRGKITAIALDPSPAPTAPPVTTRSAFELRLQTEIRNFYQFESSTDLATWEEFDAPIFGDGSVVSKFVTQPADPTVFYRAVIQSQLGNGVTPTNMRTFAFSGSVVQLDNVGGLDGSIGNGTPVSGFYSFDKTAVDTNNDPTVGLYANSAPGAGIVMKVGDSVFRTNPAFVDFLVAVVNRPAEGGSGDNYLVRSSNNISSRPVVVGEIAWQLDDSSGTALSSDDLPETPPDLGSFTQPFGLTVGGGYVQNNQDRGFLIRAAIDSIVATPISIPEAPAVEIGAALELWAETALGPVYQFQSSANNVDWIDIGPPIIGAGESVSRFVPRQNGLMYRVVINSL